jgi:hypothetical protein
MLFPGDVARAKSKVPIARAQKRAVEFVRIDVLRDTVVRRCGIERGKDQPAIAVAVVEGLLQEQLQPARVLLPVSCSLPIGLQTSRIRGDFHAFKVPAALGNDIDDSQKRVRPIE